jgi:hypothetical protein
MTTIGEVTNSSGKKTIIQIAKINWNCGVRRHHGSGGKSLGGKSLGGVGGFTRAIMPTILIWLDQSSKVFGWGFFIFSVLEEARQSR